MTSPVRTSARTIRRRVRVAKASVASGARMARGDTPRIGYVGFVGAANVGDDAIFLAEQRAFPRARVIPVPDARHAHRVFGVAGALAGGRPLDGVLLGGGTLVGRFEWWERVVSVLERYPALPAFTVGVGVEDPEFEAAGPLTSRHELARWASLLRGFSRVSVRGPRSRRLLAEVGIDAPVVGDPALLLRPPGDVAPARRRLALNVAVPEFIWGGDHEAVTAAVIGAGRRLLADGWEIDLIAFRPTDTNVTQHVGRALSSGSSGRVRMIEGWRDLDALLAAMARCSVVVGERLHAVVLAAACGVPSVMLEYRPKCADFVESLGPDPGVVLLRTDALSAPAIVDAVELLEHDGERSRARLDAAVARLRATLHTEVELVCGVPPFSST